MGTWAPSCFSDNCCSARDRTDNWAMGSQICTAGRPNTGPYRQFSVRAARAAAVRVFQSRRREECSEERGVSDRRSRYSAVVARRDSSLFNAWYLQSFRLLPESKSVRNWLLLKFNSYRFSLIDSNLAMFRSFCDKRFVHLDVSSFICKHFSTKVSKSPNSSKTLVFPNKSDSVIDVFKNFGFTETHMAKIFTTCPFLLVSNADRIIKPKLDFFSKNGLLGQALAEVIAKNPFILGRSLDKQLVPCFAFLKSFYGTTDGIVALLSDKRGIRFLHTFSEEVAPNVDTLRRHGVPDSNIEMMILLRPHKLSWKTCQFSEIVRSVMDMGFDPKSKAIVHGISTMAGMKKDKWVSKVEVFKSFGWTEQQVQLLFMKQPKVMASSEERLKMSLDFFMNKLKWTTDVIMKYPSLLCASFEGRLWPRFSIVHVLITRGLINKTSIGHALLVSDDTFLKNFLLKYQDKLPQILEMYVYRRDKTGCLQLVASS